MLNICPKEFDKTEAAWSLLCLRGREDKGHVAGVLVSSPEGAGSPSCLCQETVEGHADSCGQVLLMLQRGLGESSVGDVTGRQTGSRETGKTPGRGELVGPRGPQGGGSELS